MAFGFFVRWLNSWFQQHASEEFRLKRLLLDIRRANILIETALEWEKDAPGAMPKELLTTLSRNMFADRDGHDDVPPVETLASALLGSAAGAKLRLGDAEVSLDRKSIRSALSALRRRRREQKRRGSTDGSGP